MVSPKACRRVIFVRPKITGISQFHRKNTGNVVMTQLTNVKIIAMKIVVINCGNLCFMFFLLFYAISVR